MQKKKKMIKMLKDGIGTLTSSFSTTTTKP